jgi:hypothetical protein
VEANGFHLLLLWNRAIYHAGADGKFIDGMGYKHFAPPELTSATKAGFVFTALMQG